MKEENDKELQALEVNNLYNSVLQFAFYFISQGFRYSVKVVLIDSVYPSGFWMRGN